MKMLEGKQVVVPGNNIIRFDLQSTGKKFIVGRVVNNPVCLEIISRNYSFAKNKAEKSSDCLVIIYEMFLNLWILQNPTNLLHDIQGGPKLKLLLNPEFLKPCRGRVPTE